MAITYPLSMPSAPMIYNVRFRPIAVNAVNRSPYTLQQQVQAHDGQAWRADVALRPRSRAEAEYWITWRLKLNGREGTFYLTHTAGATPRGTAAGSPVVDGGSQTGQELAVKGFTPNATLLAGDWVQLGSGAATRLYKNLDDVTADGSGDATLTLWPALRSSPGDEDPLTLSNAAGLFRMASDEMPWEIDKFQLFDGFDFSADEAL